MGENAAATGATVALASSFMLYRLYQSILPKPIPGIAYDEAAAKSPLGDLPAMLRQNTGSTMDWIAKRARQHNDPLCQLFLQPLSQPMLVLSDFRESQDILMRRSREWDRTDWSIEIFKGVVPEHHINLKLGDQWKTQRRLLQDLMSPEFLNNVAGPNIWASTKTLLTLWAEKARIADGRAFSVVDDIYYVALDAVLAFSFGTAFPHRSLVPQLKLLQDLGDKSLEHTKNENPQDVAVFKEAPLDETLQATLHISTQVGAALQNVSVSLSYFMQGFSSSNRKLRKAREQQIYNEIAKAVARRQQQEKGREAEVRSAVDLMVDRETWLAEKEGRKPEYFSPVMRDEVMGFVVAGHDTSSTTLLWGLKLLADHPESQKKLKEALLAGHPAAAAEERLPTAHEIASTNIPYLSAVIEEVLRCGCTVPALERQCNQDTMVLGHPVPKGTMMLLLSTGPSFNEPRFEVKEELRNESCRAAGQDRQWDPEGMDQFRPERWLKEEDGEIVFDSTAGPTLPFGLGLRGCFGRRLAYLELRIIITLLFWSFDEFMKCPEHLSSYEAVDEITHKPKMCYVKLKTKQTGA
ncbi:cytochrome P450 [Stachybotrys elegans]|uniref:Cytochrome P450 n=1 Tax=Stachybotrys elegans TaxID=80388 RepID=A0A8K0SL23_9HYPO|nr:cytochrome P450 [Stachybotrys elegans]